MADVHELLDTWIANVKDEELLAELNTMKEQGDEDAITDAFFQDLAFGTAGLRGTIGAGTNRMNIYTAGARRADYPQCDLRASDVTFWWRSVGSRVITTPSRRHVYPDGSFGSLFPVNQLRGIVSIKFTPPAGALSN